MTDAEIKQAKKDAAQLYVVGTTFDKIAERLSLTYGPNYYAKIEFKEKLDVWRVMRINETGEDFVIIEKGVRNERRKRRFKGSVQIG